MEKLLICLLLLYNAFLVFQLLKDKRNHAKEPLEGGAAKQTLEPEGIVGESLFRMGAKTPQATDREPQNAILAENGHIEDVDITFADETGKPSMARLPDDQLDAVFADVRISDIPVEYEGEGLDEGIPGPQLATGASFEEIGQAVATANGTEATDEECFRAGRVFTEMEGNALFEKLVKTSDQRAKRISGLMDYFLSKSISSDGEFAKEVAQPQNMDGAPENIDRFDIRDFV